MASPIPSTSNTSSSAKKVQQPKSKSIYRQPDARHFQLLHKVYRGDQDGTEEGDRELAEFKKEKRVRGGDDQVGLDYDDEESTFGSGRRKRNPNPGQAPLYGVFYPDDDYDYLQHLRPIHALSTSVTLPTEDKRVQVEWDEVQKGKKRKGDDNDDDDGGENDSKKVTFEAERNQDQKVSRAKAKENAILQKMFPSTSNSTVTSSSSPTTTTTTSVINNYLTHLSKTSGESSSTRAKELLLPDGTPDEILKEILEALEDEAYLVDGEGKSVSGSKVGRNSKKGKGKEEIKENVLVEEMAKEDKEKDPMANGINKDKEVDDDDDDLFQDEDEDEDAELEGEEDSDEAFFNEIIQGGPGPKPHLADSDELSEDQFGGGEEEEFEWEKQMAMFKKPRRRQSKSTGGSGSDVEEEESDRDTLGPLRSFGDKKGKKKGGSSSSRGRSEGGMSAADVSTRSAGLRDLDERFAEIEKAYATSSDEDEEDDYDPLDPDSVPPTLPSNLTPILDDFLSRYQLLGSKLEAKSSPNETGAQRLNELRKALLTERNENENGDGDAKENDEEEEMKRRVLDRALRIADREERREREGKQRIPLPVDLDAREAKWDVESILSLQSNVSNHPQMLRLKKSVKNKRGDPKIRLDPKTGMPSTEDDNEVGKGKKREENDDVSSSSSDDNGTIVSRATTTISRSRFESPEFRRARKAEVKAQRRERRAEKKETKEAFGREKKKQIKTTEGRGMTAGTMGSGDGRVGRLT